MYYTHKYLYTLYSLSGRKGCAALESINSLMMIKIANLVLIFIYYAMGTFPPAGYLLAQHALRSCSHVFLSF